jgi:hypothetical protein
VAACGVLNADDRKLVSKYAQARAHTNFGTHNEATTAATGSNWAVDNNNYVRNILKVEAEGKKDIQFRIVGRVDRIETREDGTKVLIEIKNRTRRLFAKTPDYEYIQVQVYLELLGLENGRLVQQHNNSISEEEIKRSQDFWKDEILPKLTSFCLNFASEINKA